MFTGIIETVGHVDSINKSDSDAKICFAIGKLDMNDVKTGDSIAVNGVCLTVVEKSSQSFCADVSSETLSLTTLGALDAGSPVNLEKALTPQTRMGGHIVSGHVDGIGSVRTQSKDGDSIRLEISVPDTLAKYVARKGSICVDGVSLTVNNVNGSIVRVNIIPHTQIETIISTYEQDTTVNIEVDLVARYLERLLMGDKAAAGESAITTDFLSRCGFR